MSKANDKAVKAYNLTTKENILNDPTCPRVERIARPSCCSFCDSKAGFYSRPSEDNEHSHRDCKCVEIPRLKNGSVEYKKNRAELTEGEKLAIDMMVSYGFNLIALKEDSWRPKNFDFLINRKLYEHKNITTDSSISNQIKRARDKFWNTGVDKSRFIFTTVNSPLTEKEQLEGITKRMRINELAYLITPNKIVKITKK